MEFPVPPRVNRRGAAVPRRLPVNTVEMIDLTIRPDTPDPRPPKRIRPTPIPAPSPPPSPTGDFWSRWGGYDQVVPHLVNKRNNKLAPRRLLPALEDAVRELKF